VKSKASWYGTWPRKSIASTHIARETILADKPKNAPSSSDLSRFEPARKSSVASQGRPPSMFLGKSRGTSDITMGGIAEAGLSLDKTDKTDKTDTSPDKKDKIDTLVDKKAEGDTAKNIDEEMKGPSVSNVESTPRPVTSSGWLGGWLGTTAVTQADTTGLTSSAETQPQAPTETIETASIKVSDSDPSTTIVCEEPPKEVTSPVQASSASWFGLWTTTAPSITPETTDEQPPVKTVENDHDTIMEDAPPADAKIEPSKAEPAAGSSWAFWSSTDTTKDQNIKKANSSPVKDPGELAVEGKASETHPEPVQAVKPKDDKSSKPTKRGRPVSTEDTEVMKKALPIETPSTKVTPSQSPAPGKTAPPNLLMPSVRGTYRLVENPSILQQLTQILLRGHQKPAKHVFLAKEPPKIRKALAIGIHGLFPAPLLRTVIGQPTGTSIRFANHAADAIRRWGDSRGCTDCEIEKVALEGEGKIAERVDNLWKLLLNWMDHVRKADFIMFACHSQGVPVAIMLIAKLIEFGVVSTGRIGVCAMGRLPIPSM